MSCQKSSDNSSTITEESSDCDAEIENLSQIQDNAKRTHKAFGSWKYTNTVIPDKKMLWKVNSKKGNGS